MTEFKDVILTLFRYTFYIRILTLILVNIYLFYYLAVLLVKGETKVFFMLMIPFIFIIIFILALSYVNLLNARGIETFKRGIYSRIFLYLVFEGLALIITGLNNRFILLYFGIIDLFLAFVFSRKTFKIKYK